uniref:Trimethyllysine dioxygenase, mitochondrial n=1 Tax=Anopheles christyi TaxID=43041 RepID=A0A182K094_9DIPT
MSKLRSCCVPCCKDEKFSLVHKFPSDNDRAEQWRRVLGIDSFIGLPIEIIRKRYYICSRHFRDSDYKNKASRSINITAVPSINLITLNNPEGLFRDLPPPNRPGLLLPAGQCLDEQKEEQDQSGEKEYNGEENNIKPGTANTSTLSMELDGFIEASFTEAESSSGNEISIIEVSKLDPLVIPSQQKPSVSLKRSYTKQSVPSEPQIIAIDSFLEPRVKVPPTETNNVLRRPVVTKPTINVVPQAVPVSPIEKGSLVLKRVKVPTLMVERKKCALTSTMTQTDDTVVDEPDKPPSQADGEQDDKDVKATTSTKVLALLECTPENLQRLQRKLQDEGGALCLDERLLRLDDEEAESDKAMKPDKADGTADATRFLTVRNDQTDESVSVSYVWLRDHCRCEECYNVATFQRSTSILDLPLDIQPASCDICDGKIDIVWQDGHRSSYDLSLVMDNYADNHRKRLEEHRSQLVLWDRELISTQSASYARVTLNDLLCEDSVMRQVVGSLITYGFAFITKVPPNQQSTEMAVKRIFPVQRTLFGDMWTFSESKMDHSDTAYTNGFLGPHTDNTYFSDAAGLQVLHCIQFNGKGGETLLVDGFRAVERLRASDPAVYERLCEYPLEAEYIEEDKHHRYVAPVIKRHRMLTDAVEQIRFNPYDRAPMRTLAPGEVPQFYADYRKLAEELHREEAQWKFQLTPGTVLIFDNWRVLHGRMAYSGKRVMTGCYVARTEYQSVARTMQLIE